MTAFSHVLLGLLVVCVSLQSGCSRSHEVRSEVPREEVSPETLSSTEAATHAAQLANDECERLYQRRPFTADQHSPVLQGGQYSWGGLDVAAPAGYSALVTFQADGSEPEVEVYWSTDTLQSPPPEPLELQEPP